MSDPAAAAKADDIVVCDACPVLCRIRVGKTGACDRYGNVDGKLARLDSMLVAEQVAARGGAMVPFREGDWSGNLLHGTTAFVTGIGAGTTYPDYKPAPFIIASQHRDIDTITVVTEGIFSYCGLKLKIDTDRFVGPEQAAVRVEGEQVGHVTTAEYGSQMLALGGVRHLTGGSKKEGVVTCDTLLTLCNKGAVDLAIDGGATMTVQAGQAPVINGAREERMRVGCGSATIGIFARQWHGHVDEVIVVDDHITGVLTEHQAGRCLDMRPAGLKVRGRQEPHSSEDVDRTDVLVMSERTFRCLDDPPLHCLPMIRMQFCTPLRHSANACFGPEEKRILPRGPDVAGLVKDPRCSCTTVMEARAAIAAALLI